MACACTQPLWAARHILVAYGARNRALRPCDVFPSQPSGEEIFLPELPRHRYLPSRFHAFGARVPPACEITRRPLASWADTAKVSPLSRGALEAPAPLCSTQGFPGESATSVHRCWLISAVQQSSSDPLNQQEQPSVAFTRSAAARQPCRGQLPAAHRSRQYAVAHAAGQASDKRAPTQLGNAVRCPRRCSPATMAAAGAPDSTATVATATTVDVF